MEKDILQNSSDCSSKKLCEDKDNCITTGEYDPYFYTKRKDFTSEIFKIEIGNLPSYVGYGQLRKLLNAKLKLDPHKIKAIGNPPQFAFITFKSEQDRDRALISLQGFKWKGKELYAKKANPMADPLVKKRRAGDSEDSPAVKKERKDENLSVSVRLKNAVTPLWDIPYEDQLKKKEEELHNFLVKLGKQIEKVNKSLLPILQKNRKENNFQCCPMTPIKASPSVTAYRNKCEFTVGKHLESGERTVGFRLNRYKEGSMSVAEPDDCINIPESMLKAVKLFQNYVRTSNKDVFNPETHDGYWRQLTVRTSRNADVMIIVVMHPQALTAEDLEIEMQQIEHYFKEGPGASCGVTSVFFQTYAKKQSEAQQIPLKHLYGKKYIEETLLEMTFRISPEAFFQINTAAAEVLCATIAEVVGSKSDSSILDICCGTGTIGLSLAKKAEKVIGVELCPQAVEDARINAELNKITNAEFLCGKAEDMIISAIKKVEGSEVVAVVDPPRAGIHNKILKVIRGNQHIETLVYISCNANAAMTNFIDLCRPSSNNYKGNPFFPMKVVPVDLFPHTPHCELVIVFKRIASILPNV